MGTSHPGRQPLGPAAPCLPSRHPGLYQPRRAADSPLYRIVQDTLETYLAEAAPGTIRKLYGTSVERNATHGSDAPDTAREEVAFFFPEL